MFHYIQGTNSSFHAIADTHYTNLLYMEKQADDTIKYKTPSLINKLDKLCAAGGSGIDFFNHLKAEDCLLLKKIIISKPQDLKTIIADFETHTASGRYPAMTEDTGGGETLSAFGKKIKGLFDYGTFSKKTATWSAYKLADLLGIDVCPYCNRNFTFTVRTPADDHARPEFDHFLSKSQYPYLALSFYNLIPSCHTCNSNLKHMIEFNFDDYLHPYEHSFNDALRFSVVLKTKADADLVKEKHSFGLPFFYGDLDSFDLRLKPREGGDPDQVAKAKKNDEVFKLEILYNRHKDMVVEMVQNSIVYDDDYVISLFNKFQGTLFRNSEDVMRHITGNYIPNAEMPKRAFSKLSRDIHTEFGLSL